MSLLSFLLSAVYFYVSGTVFFDLVHYLLHQWSRSRWRLLRFLSRCHSYHHLYYPASLQFNPKYAKQNALIALPLELICQLLGTILNYVAVARIHVQILEDYNLNLQPGRSALLFVLIFSTLRSVYVILNSGRDSNHIALSTVPKDTSCVTVGPEYHALHHVHPDRYMGSLVRLFDWIMGTAYSIRGKNIVMTGGSGAFGQALEKQFQAEKVRSITKLKFGVDWTHQGLERSKDRDVDVFVKADILVLAHGTKGPDAMESNCTASIRLIESFLHSKKVKSNTQYSKHSKTLPEIWYIGSEAELHPSFGDPIMTRYTASKRAFLNYARALYASDAVVYRHIVPAAFQSSMGWAAVSADWAAKTAFWWIRRGAWYVPVTYTGFAYLNYFKFLWGEKMEGWVEGSKIGVRGRGESGVE